MTTVANVSPAPVAEVQRRRIRSRLPGTLVIGIVILLFYLVVAVTAPLWAPYPFSKTGTGRPYESPSAAHLFGTDQIGRDVFSRVVNGTRVVLFLAFTSTLIATVIGGLIGLLSGYLGGWLDELVMRFFELLISIPLLVFALLVIAAAGPEQAGRYELLIGVVVVLYTPRIARMTRAVAVDLVMRDFVTVARLRGESAWSIVWRELLPNASSVLLVEFGVRAGWAPILIGSLGFLGMGVRPPTPEWGLMLSEGRSGITISPMVALAPAAALAGLVIGINLCTDGLARMLGRQVEYGS